MCAAFECIDNGMCILTICGTCLDSMVVGDNVMYDNKSEDLRGFAKYLFCEFSKYIKLM